MSTKSYNVSQLAILVAKTQLGLEEENKGNWGASVERFLKSVGINFPASWCMAFVYWCFKLAFEEIGIENPLIKTGGVLRQWNEIDKKYKSQTPQIGSIFIMDLGRGLGHTGIVISIDGDKLSTIEGNTNDEGSREGYEVCMRTRKKSEIKGYINIS